VRELADAGAQGNKLVARHLQLHEQVTTRRNVCAMRGSSGERRQCKHAFYMRSLLQSAKIAQSITRGDCNQAVRCVGEQGSRWWRAA
jgi:hypothetical protein